LLASKKSKKISKKITLSDNAPRIMANRIIREASWFVLLFIGLYMTLALGTFNPQDPSWSNAVEAGVKVSNLAGIFGAYFSDFSLYFWSLCLVVSFFKSL
jgi:S-DNA-T family DNA segregation ATPase FtsK/SpoIIIE